MWFKIKKLDQNLSLTNQLSESIKQMESKIHDIEFSHKIISSDV